MKILRRAAKHEVEVERRDRGPVDRGGGVADEDRLQPLFAKGIGDPAKKRRSVHGFKNSQTERPTEIGGWRDGMAGAAGCGPESDRRCRLLCWRAMLRIENLDARGALADAEQAIGIAPTSSQPRRVSALAHVILDDADAALEDAEAAVTLSGHADPEALNHRAYIRALVGRDLEAALADIDAALPPDGEGSPEFLDTKGFVLHLLGRHHEAVDLLNVAIDATQKTRRRLMELSPHADPDELAYRVRSVDHALAVMHQHRGLACRALGLAGQAAQDLETAERKGYAPQRGIF